MRKKQHRKKSLLAVFYMTAIIVVAATAVSVGTLFCIEIYHSNAERVSRDLDSVLLQADELLNRDLESIYNVTDQLATDSQLGTAVEQYCSGNPAASARGYRTVDYILHQAQRLSPHAKNIAVLFGDRVIQADQYSLNWPIDFDAMKQMDWYRRLMDNEILYAFGISTDLVQEHGAEQYYFCAAKFRSKFYLDRRSEDRIVVVTYRMDPKTTEIDALIQERNISLMLYDSNSGRILCSGGRDGEFCDVVDRWSGQVQDFSDLEEDCIVLEKINRRSGWVWKGFVRRTAFWAMAHPLRLDVLTVLLVVLLADAVLTVTVVRKALKPLGQVAKAMEDLGNQDFYSLPQTGGYEETDRMVRTFNRMSQRIQDLIHSIEQEEQNKRKAEFRALENQINPHFLYNTLDAARWVALMNQDRATAGMIGSMSKLLRISLSGGRESIPVAKEVEMLREYVNIMTMRNNYTVDFHYEMEPGVESLLTLKMVLQPLVENCFNHAFPPEQESPEVTIRCYSRDEMLVMEVIDNGQGMRESGDNRTDHKKDPRFSGIGRHNIDERIKLWYGEKYGLTAVSHAGCGTTVTLTQPVIEQSEGGSHDTDYAGGR